MRAIELRLRGHLTPEVLSAAFAAIKPELDVDDARIHLRVDCREMTGYALSARSTFVTWNREHRARIARVAVITANPLWQMVVSAMSLASGQTMKAFSSADAATAWLHDEPHP